MLSIKGLTNTFSSDSANRSDILGIIPKQYTNNNTITAYENSSLNWVNEGEDFLLSSLKIEILDPETKKVATDVGSSNAVYLEVFKTK